MNKVVIFALICGIILVSGCLETQSQISQQQEEEAEITPEISSKGIDLEVTEINCENTEGDINVPNDFAAHCWGTIKNNGINRARHVKINFVFHDAGDIVGQISIQPISGGGDVPPGESRNFETELEIKRPYSNYNYDVTYPEQFVG
jgi:hypothetical protein